MKIIRFKYEDRFRKWKLNSMKFQKLNLLVGASGVGKTQILNAVADLKKITEGYSINGLKWEIEFSIAGADYLWAGEFENLKDNELITFYDIYEDDKERKKKKLSKIIKEKLCQYNTVIIERDQENIFLKQNKTVKLPQEKSAINLLKEENDIAIVFKSFQKIIFRGFDTAEERFVSDDMIIDSEKNNNIDEIRKSDEGLRAKLYLASVNAKKIFGRIKSRFMDVFPYVENLRIRRISLLNTKVKLPVIQIKEKGVDEWIHEDRISSGMLRSLLHISELHLCADGTVILVDEFENSLGINCIDEITSEIVTQKRDLQFIITSHHPYIINKISHKNWKLITRKAGVVTAKDADEFKLSRSKHEAFTQLINLDAYTEGIEV